MNSWKNEEIRLGTSIAVGGNDGTNCQKRYVIN